MRDIDWYIKTAVYNQRLSSPRALGPALGKSPNSASNWATRRAWPSDEVMVQLAEMCGVPPEEALVELCIWRTAGTPAGNVYVRLLEAAGKSAAVLLVALLAYAASGTPAHAVATEHVANKAAVNGPGTKIMRQLNINGCRRAINRARLFVSRVFCALKQPCINAMG